MKYIKNNKIVLFALAAAMVFTSCNKEMEEVTAPAPPPATGSKLGDTLKNSPNDSLYYRMLVHSGLLNSVNNSSTRFTMFVPSNSAMRSFISVASGGLVPNDPLVPNSVFSNFITTNLPQATAAGIVSYNIDPQAIYSSSIPATFPNFQYPSILNPAPAVSALLRLTNFPSTRNGGWVNNIPLTGVDLAASNGVIHHTAAVMTPPQRYLWNRIDADPELTYLKAAINRADSGTGTPGALQSAMLNIGANLTVFAPTDAAFQATLTGAITQALVLMGTPLATAQAQAAALASTPDVFNNPALFGVLTAQTVKGIVVYHVLGTRAFTNNFPTTSTQVTTLLNSAIPAHPGLGIAAVFGAPFVSSATVKGAANATAANIVINASPLLPDPVGTSDQHYLNGVLHKIDQVLLPQ